MSQSPDRSSDLFQSQVLDNVQKFAESSAKLFNSMLGSSFVANKAEIPKDGIAISENKIIASIMFTGMVYGEYMFVLDEKVAANLIAQTANVEPKSAEQLRTEIADTFGELLNVVVGESVVGLGKIFKKLTITAPKILFGQANYPKIRTGKAVLTSSAGTIDCYLYIDRMKLDIASSYKEAMSSLVQANKELKDAMRKLHEQQSLLIQAEKMGALGTMAAGVVHEINTPLSTISVLGGQLKDLAGADSTFDRDSFIDMINKIEATISRISKVTNSLKTFALGIRGEAPAFKAISEIIEDALVLSEQNLEQKGIQIKKNITNVLIECRHSEICQVLINVISNACDAIESLSSKWILIETLDFTDAVEIRVTDSGTQIAPKIHNKIFDPFFTTKELGKGPGLGLSVARGIMQAHNGTITLDTSSTHTCFVIRLFKALKKAN